MLDRTEAEDFLARVAIAALGYHPDKAATEPGYTLDEDIDWCLQALPTVPAEHRENMRARVRAVIEDPTRERHAFVHDVRALADE